MKSLADLSNNSEFVGRHIGVCDEDKTEMLESLGYKSLDSFISAVVPKKILLSESLDLDDAVTEIEALNNLGIIAKKNKVLKNFIGQGYYNTITPNVILRNVFENPAWYTAYTPYQPEISQGRLEALLNFQTMIVSLTGMDLASASLLDEGTAAAEAMMLCRRMSKSKEEVFFVDKHCYSQTIEVIKTRAEPIGIKIVVGDLSEIEKSNFFGVLLQYPGEDGAIRDFSRITNIIHNKRGLVVIASDILSLLLLKSPGEIGADVAIGSTQRFGIPLGFGGPHAAYMATRNSFKRSLPGRLVGVSLDSAGKPAYRLALQTREQHIRREKATSNICTAQALLAVMASMYAVYHGPNGLKYIAEKVHHLTVILASGLKKIGCRIVNESFFDTLTINTNKDTTKIHSLAVSKGLNLRMIDDSNLGISLDERTSLDDIESLWRLFDKNTDLSVDQIKLSAHNNIPKRLLREDEPLTHPVFNSYQSETEMLRYLRKLSDKDIALDRAMIPLGSCTMKLNATAEMIPVSWPEFANIHPFAPNDQVSGYIEMIEEVESMLCVVTGYDAVSLQPNAGSQGEYAGLLAIRSYHASRGESHRDVCLIPSSAHGTNPASAQMCGMRVVVTACDDMGNVDLEELRSKADLHSDNLAAIMITYPSTHGVFEDGVIEVCNIVHQHGGQVYIDGANLNAMVGICKPGEFGGDVSHLNLHKTFCIPHGGGGPGIGPVAVRQHLAPYLPGNKSLAKKPVINTVSSAPWGSASILPITWMYMKMMGYKGLRHATEIAILNANYIADRLKDAYEILYTGKNDRVAHECIIDLRAIKDSVGVTVDDVAKRLIDYGFHAPTMSFPVPGTLMIEPTESESKKEIDRFCDAMLAIRKEIDSIQKGVYPIDDNPLCHAPHTAEILITDNWNRSYKKETAAYPVATLKNSKYWPPVGRIDNVHGDKNLICSCLPVSEYE
ncbi:aminomethyl-transferring glycine dehydrogenase [Porticoccus sp.]|jgi:glycine dehydrogenase|nr:aminomethyl-transferring glycine dehydrogenase [Gammaproteobacteria bacterium]MDC1270902.1 aminomethyl-transferring glycine dehydrogenase [Porticoccus sp.]